MEDIILHVENLNPHKKNKLQQNYKTQKSFVFLHTSK